MPQEININAVVEVDDLKHALSVVSAIERSPASGAYHVDITSRWLATLREHYVAVGREVERTENIHNRVD